MFKGTTPTIIFTLLTEVSLSDLEEMWVTMVDASGTLHNWELTDITVDADKKEVSLVLTQSEVNNIATGQAQCQIRFLTSEGKAYATKIGLINIEATLKSGVIS